MSNRIAPGTVPIVQHLGIPRANPILRKVVFDLDDVLWGYADHLMRQIRIPYQKHIEFKVEEDPLLAPEERERLQAAFGEVRFCGGLEFYPGLSGIMNLQRYGADPQIKSNSFSREIADYKLHRLAEALPELPTEKICLEVIGPQTTTQKDFDDDAFAVVDDCPYHIACSKAAFNIMPIHPWNQTAKARRLVAGKKVFYVPAGDISIICTLLQSLLLECIA